MERRGREMERDGKERERERDGERWEGEGERERESNVLCYRALVGKQTLVLEYAVICICQFAG